VIGVKIEANPTPEQLKWLVIALAVLLGVGHEQVMAAVGL
jgi:hypothetical protein